MLGPIIGDFEQKLIGPNRNDLFVLNLFFFIKKNIYDIGIQAENH